MQCRKELTETKPIILPKLPHDIVLEILSRLPVKSLLRFKCVCKPWNTLISDPQFAKHQLKQNKTRNLQKVFLSTWPPRSIDFESYSDKNPNGNIIRDLHYPSAVKGSDPYVMIMGSCDGLIFLLDNEDNIFLWNPTTGDFKELPKPIGPINGMFCHGVGYNSCFDDYQVVLGTRTILGNGSEETTFELYTLKTNVWRRISRLNSKSFKFEGVGTYWNGTLHWLAIQGSESNKVYGIVSFDFEDEKFKEILSSPNRYDPTMYYTLNLGFSGNSLCVFCQLYVGFFEAYVVNESGTNTSWTLMFKVAHDRFPGYSNKAMCLSKNGEVVFDFDGWQLGLYKPKQVIKYLNICNDWDWDSDLYLDSLVSPNYY